MCVTRLRPKISPDTSSEFQPHLCGVLAHGMGRAIWEEAHEKHAWVSCQSYTIMSMMVYIYYVRTPLLLVF